MNVAENAVISCDFLPVSYAVQSNPRSQYQEIEQQLFEVTESVELLVCRLHTHQLNLRPEPDRWSVGECLEHLILFSEAFIPIISVACSTARDRQLTGPGPFKMDLIGRVLRLALEPPIKLRTTTSRSFQPFNIEPVEELLPRFLLLQGKLIEEVRASEGLDLNQIQVASPVSSRVRYNLYSCFHVIVTHQRRHLWQAEETIREIEKY